MKLNHRQEEDALIVSVLEPRLDSAATVAFKDRMIALLAQPCARVLLDLRQVRFLDSSGLGAVVFVMKRLAPDRHLELVGLQPAVAKVFRLTRIDSLIKIHTDLPMLSTHTTAEAAPQESAL